MFKSELSRCLIYCLRNRVSDDGMCCFGGGNVSTFGGRPMSRKQTLQEFRLSLSVNKMLCGTTGLARRISAVHCRIGRRKSILSVHASNGPDSQRCFQLPALLCLAQLLREQGRKPGRCFAAKKSIFLPDCIFRFTVTGQSLLYRCFDLLLPQ